MKQVAYSARGLPFLVPLALSAGPLVALGFFRFAYTLILPAMGQSLGWSLTTDGMMNTANALGYLLGAISASSLARRAGLPRTLLAGIVITSLAMVATGITGNTITSCMVAFGKWTWRGRGICGRWRTRCTV